MALLDFLPALLVDLAIYLVNFTLQHVLADRLGRTAEAELPLAIFSNAYVGAYVLGTLGLGLIADRPGWRRPSIFVGLLVLALVTIFMATDGLARSLPVFYGTIAVAGLGSAFFWPALQARIGDRWDQGRLPAALNRFNVGWTLGKALGLWVAGLLYGQGPRYALVAAAAAVLLALACQVLDRAPEVAARPAPSVSEQKKKRGFLVSALATNFALWGLATTVIALIPVLGAELGIGDGDQGFLCGGLVLAQSVVFMLLGKSRRWTYRRLLVIGVALLGALAALGLYAASGVMAAAIASLAAGALGGAAYAFSIFYSLDYDERRGLRMSVNEAVLGLGGLFVPLAGSGLARATHVSRMPYLLAGAMCLGGALLSSFLLRTRAEYS